MKPTYYECGICAAMHRADWDGDCRQNDARFFVEELDARHEKTGWEEIDMEDVDVWRLENGFDFPLTPNRFQPNRGFPS